MASPSCADVFRLPNRQAVTLAVAAFGLLVLAACTGEDEPTSTANASPAPSASPTVLPATTEPTAAARRQAPPVVGETVDGRRIDAGTFAGAPLVLFFWREHISGIDRELQLMQEFYDEFSPAGVEFLTVTDREHDLGLRTRSILDRAGVTLPTILMPDGALMLDYGVGLPPGVALIDAEQRIAWTWYGFIDRQRVGPEIAKLAAAR